MAHITGIFVRVQTDAGGFENKDIAELSDAELDRFIKHKGGEQEEGWRWARSLARWIRDNVKVASPEE